MKQQLVKRACGLAEQKTSYDNLEMKDSGKLRKCLFNSERMCKVFMESRKESKRS